MAEVELSAGTIEYEDTGGPGPTVVLRHGLAMDGSLWRRVVGELRADHRCIVPTLPLGGHKRPMRPNADLSPRGIAELEAEFVQALGLSDVTLVGNNQGSFQIAAAEHPERIARLVITSCEAFENFPPGLPGRSLSLAARLPGGLNAAFQPLRIRALRRSPVVFGRMAKHPIPDGVTDAWLRPLLTRREIRRDLTKYLRAGEEGRNARRGRAPAVVRPSGTRDLGKGGSRHAPRAWAPTGRAPSPRAVGQDHRQLHAPARGSTGRVGS